MKDYSNDQLRKITDEDLVKEYLAVRSKINTSRKKKENTVDLEIYFCYVSREVQERENKKVIKKVV